MRFFSCILLMVFFASCQNEQPILKATSTDDPLPYLSAMTRSSMDELKGLTVIKYDEYFDSNMQDMGGSFAGFFRDNSEQKADIGDVTFDNVNINVVENRYLEDLVTSKPLIPKEIDFVLDPHINSASSEAIFPYSIDTKVYVPTELDVKSNIGTGEFFTKEIDIELTWTTDPIIDEVYFAYCADGAPCDYKILPDIGRATISKTEFSNVPIGGKVFFRMARYKENCVSANNKRETCIYSVINARTPGLTIK